MKRILFGLLLLLWSSITGCSPSATSATPDTVRIRWARDPENLDPLIANNPSSYEVSTLLHCSLLNISDTGRNIVPWLAAASPQVERLGDSLMLVSYSLRPEATWDNGKPIVAQDVAFTLKMMNCPGLPTEMDQAMFHFIQDIRLDTTDSRRFTLVCTGQSSDYVRNSGDFSVLPEYALDPKGSLRSVSIRELRSGAATAYASVTSFVQRYQAAQLAQHPDNLPGCGPYQLKNWQPGRFLTFTRKLKWWGDALTKAPPILRAVPKSITYQIIPDAGTAMLALRRGDIDLYPLMPAAEFARLRRSDADRARLSFYTVDSYECVVANFNTRQPTLQDRFTRQALSALFDVPGLIRATQQGAAYRSASIVSPRVHPYYNDSLPLPTYDTQQAITLLRKAGWREVNGQGWVRKQAGKLLELRLSLSYRAGDPALEAAALQFRAAATAIRIPVDLRPTEASLLVQQLREGTTEVSLRSIGGNPAAYDFTPLFHSNSTSLYNYSGFGTPASDHLIEAIVQTPDTAQKTRLLRRFQRLLYTERPIYVLYFLQYRIAAARRLGRVPVTSIKPSYRANAIDFSPVTK